MPIELLYKKVDGIEIFLDVYLPDSASAASPVPILLWWHGGGLLQGTRKAVSPHMLEAPSKHNLCLVSADYRLAPQTRMPAILADCKDAVEFLGSTKFVSATGNRADASKIFVSGSSAGGWLALLAGTGIGYRACGLELPPRVKGIIAIYPITDLLDPFWTTKQRPVSYMNRVIDDSEVKIFVDPNSEKTTSSAVDGKRSIFYHYMVQEGILASLLLDGTGIPPESFSVAQSLRSGDYKPPLTYIVHGNSDRLVPHCQSTDVVDAFKAIGASVEYHEMEGLDHGFERDGKYKMENLYKFIEKSS
ncbi:Alpha/Beta hydrolase protein [Infundibulicybe gibba]|nr:Alpha/Beta hydrolase protein [Infundibulicybe gibba]